MTFVAPHRSQNRAISSTGCPSGGRERERVDSTHSHSLALAATRRSETPGLARRHPAAFAPRVLRRLLLVLHFSAAVACAQTPPPGRLRIEAPISDYDDRTGEVVHQGGAVMREGNALLTATEIRANRLTDVATATGNVVFTRGPLRLLADRIVYHRDGTFAAENVRVGSFPYYAEGASATGTATEVTVNGATLSYGEPGPWQPSLRADRLIYAPGSSCGRSAR